jgi:intracellular sulfur oxidation DsrE/DsrF family protein
LPPDFWQAPAIKDYGKIHPLPDAAYRPTRTGIYKIVFAAEAGSKDPSEPISALDHAARAVNVYASAGVPKKHMKFVVVMAGPASMAAIDNEHYKAHFKVDNPNVPLIHALRDAGVEIVLCGQAASGAFAAGNIKFEWINPEVTLALSALTAIPILEQQGYALMNY